MSILPYDKTYDLTRPRDGAVERTDRQDNSFLLMNYNDFRTKKALRFAEETKCWFVFSCMIPD